MNKKIFAALASATMALSATGSLAVFAEDFDVVEENNNGTANGTITPASEVVINEENFPDKALRDAIIKWTGKSYGDGIPTSKFNDVKEVNITAGTAGVTKFGNTVNFTVDSSLNDLQGIGFFKNITTLTVSKLTNLETVDLSENTKLQTISITEADDLEALTLPATNTLNSLTVSAFTDRAPLTVLDLSKNKALTTVTVNNTNVASIDLSNNPYLNNVDLANNGINTLDLDNSLKIAKLDVSNNHLYSLELPDSSPMLYSLNVSGNVLQEINLPSINNFAGNDLATGETTSINVSDNELRTLDLANVSNALKSLDFSKNHIAGIDLSDLVGASYIDASNQTIYINAGYNTLNLTEYSESFDKDGITTPVTNATYTKKTGVLSDITSGTSQ